MPVDHVALGQVSDLQASKEFYEKALAPLGYKVLYEIPTRAIGFGTNPYKADFWIGRSEDPSKTVTTMSHIAFTGSRAQVHAFYEAALQAGGKCNGPPGPRPNYHNFYYGAFIVDQDGNNIEQVLRVVNHGSTWQWIWYFVGLKLGFVKDTKKDY